ncbi:MAG TPA: hypothetical protein VKK79_10350 [Candidatus Lokiarchaeia archaeon]|nr:hypothetical protein [Candidatus Lokiarchaeia archaeon]
MMIRSLFIVHRNAQILLYLPLSGERPEQSALEQISAFLTALAAFSEEIGAGHVDTIFLKDTKFTYRHGKHDLLYIIEVDKGDSQVESAEVLTKTCDAFEEQFGVTFQDGLTEGMSFEDFGTSVKEFINSN